MVSGERKVFGIWDLELGFHFVIAMSIETVRGGNIGCRPSSLTPAACRLPPAPEGVPLRSKGRLYGFSSTWRFSDTLHEKLSASVD